GGMGAVYRATDTAFGREVAIKVPRADRRVHRYLERFRHEALVTGRLQHPGIPPVYQWGILPGDGRPYLVMKRVQGPTLAQLLAARQGRTTDVPRLLDIFVQVCQAVACAHKQGVVHRDLKPSNVMLGEADEVQVMDWGLAKQAGASVESPGLDEPETVESPP